MAAGLPDAANEFVDATEAAYKAGAADATKKTIGSLPAILTSDAHWTKAEQVAFARAYSLAYFGESNLTDETKKDELASEAERALTLGVSNGYAGTTWSYSPLAVWWTGYLEQLNQLSEAGYDVGFELKSKPVQEGLKKSSGWIWAAALGLVAVIAGAGFALSGEKRNPAKGKSVAKHGGYKWATTYGKISHEGVDIGDYDEQGWEHEWEDSKVYKSLADLLQDIPSHNWIEWSDSHPSGRSWITAEDYWDHHNGTRTHHDLFIRHADGTCLTLAEVKHIDQALNLRGRFDR